MHNIQLAASQIVQQVLADGRNLNQVLEESLRKKAVWTPAQRAALQDLSYGTLRFYGQLRALLGLLLHKPMPEKREISKFDPKARKHVMYKETKLK